MALTPAEHGELRALQARGFGRSEHPLTAGESARLQELMRAGEAAPAESAAHSRSTEHEEADESPLPHDVSTADAAVASTRSRWKPLVLVAALLVAGAAGFAAGALTSTPSGPRFPELATAQTEEDMLNPSLLVELAPDSPRFIAYVADQRLYLARSADETEICLLAIGTELFDDTVLCAVEDGDATTVSISLTPDLSIVATASGPPEGSRALSPSVSVISGVDAVSD